MAQNALELYKQIKNDPDLKLDIKPNYAQQPMEDYGFNFAPQEQMYFPPIEPYVEGGSTNKGQMIRGGVHTEIPLDHGSINAGVDAFHIKDGPFTQNYLTNGNLSYDTGKYSVGGEYQNNPYEYTPLDYNMEQNTPGFTGQNYLGRVKFRY